MRPARSARGVVTAVGAVILTLLAPVPAGGAGALAAAPPAFLGTLTGPSQAAMYPSGLEYDAAHDRLVVADTGRDRVLVYSLTGTLLDAFGSFGTGDGQLASPRDAAVDEDGRIYVADADNNRVQAFDADGRFLWKAGGLGQGADTLNTPIGVTWDVANDVLLVASSGQSLVKAFDAGGDRVWTSPTGNELGAHGIRDVERGPDGRIWVTAYKEHQVKVYDVSPDGTTWDTEPVFELGDGQPGGHDAGQLNFPYNVAWSPDGGTAYVSDTGNGRIARWDLSDPDEPAWLPPIGERCTLHPQPCLDPPADAGKFNHLRRVAVDSDGLVYGADFWGAGIEVFAPDGDSVRSIEGAEPPAPGVSEAYAVDVSPNGQVYVMDRLNHRIQRFAADGTYLGKVGARGTQPATFSWPEGLTVAPDGRVWAVDTRGGRIESFPADLATVPRVPSYGSTGSGPDELEYPSNADVAATGVVWIADTRNDRLMRFDPDTERFLAPIGELGAGPGAFRAPMGIAVTADAVYVADTGNDRVQRLTLGGQPVASYAAGLVGPQGLEVAPDGSVWVADSGHDRLVHLSADLVNLGDGFGGRGTGTHQFFAPHDLAFGNDRMYVADTYNNRVQVFAEPPTTEPPPPPDCVTRDARHRASLGSGPAVLSYTLAGVELCSNGVEATVGDPGHVVAREVSPARVRAAQAKLGLAFRYDGSSAPATSIESDGSAGARVSGSWASCVDLAYGDRVLDLGIRAARWASSGAVHARLTEWSQRRIVASPKIPARVKRQIADRGVEAAVDPSGIAGARTLRLVALDVVAEAFDGRARDGLRRLVAGTCLAGVWAPQVTLSTTVDGTVVDRLSGRARRLEVS